MGLPPFPAQASMRTAPKASDKIMLAVLPFENLSRDPEQEYFSDGLTEEMIAQLGRINPQKLGVIARSSAMHYKNTDRTIDHVRRELGVDYVVEGSVRQADNRVRITANLIQCSDQAQLWADSFERELKDILALQSDVARAVAQEIKVALTPQEQASTAAARPVNPEAYQAYVKGRFYWNKRTAEDLKKSVRYFEQAISLAPDWPLGHVGLADTYVVMPFWAPVRPHEAIRKAKAAAFRALQLNDSLGEAHATIATISAIYDWNWETAEREFQRAIELAPNHATTFHWYSEFLRNTGRLQEALAQSANAQELDPLSLVIGTTLAAAHLCSGDVDQAEIQLRRVLELDPDYAPAHRYLAQVFIERGRPADAVAEARIAVRNSNDEPRSVAKLGYVCAMSGQEDEARKIVNQLEVRFREGYIPPTRIAEVYLGLQEDDRMFEWLEQAFQERDVLLTYALSEPIFGRVRNDPRFVDLVRRVGLPMPETQVPPAPKPDPKEPPGGSP
jgi:TolB-like protein/Tfp pilus assembly protein PilF